MHETCGSSPVPLRRMAEASCMGWLPTTWGLRAHHLGQAVSESFASNRCLGLLLSWREGATQALPSSAGGLLMTLLPGKSTETAAKGLGPGCQWAGAAQA